MRARAKVLIAACVLGAACASQSPDFSQRLSAIEGRLDRLESSSTPDASVTPPIEDASAPVASMDALFRRAITRPARPGDGGYFPTDPAAQASEIASCKAYAPTRCTEELTQARLALQQRQPGKKPRWIQSGPPVAADSTPAGRACIQRVSQECEQRFQRDKTLMWLDAQLEPKKRDEKFTSQVRAQLAEKLGVAPESVDVACAQQFCRFGGDVRNNPRGLLQSLDGFAPHGTSDSEYLYRMRQGFELAH